MARVIKSDGKLQLLALSKLRNQPAFLLVDYISNNMIRIQQANVLKVSKNDGYSNRAPNTDSNFNSLGIKHQEVLTSLKYPIRRHKIKQYKLKLLHETRENQRKTAINHIVIQDLDPSSTSGMKFVPTMLTTTKNESSV